MRQAALAMDLALVGLVEAGHEPQQGRLAGAVRADEADSIAGGDGRIDVIEDDEVADLANDALQPDDGHQAGPPGAARRRPRRGAASRRSASSGRGPARGRSAAPGLPRPRSGPARPRRRARSSGGRARARAPAWTPAAPAGRSPSSACPPPRAAPPAAAGTSSRSASIARRRRSGGSAGRSAGTARRLAGRPQMLLHRAVALGRGVVVDRAAAPLDRLGQDVAQRPVQPADVVGAERVRVAERVEPRPPESLVGVDVADAGEEVLVHQQRLEPAAAPGEQLREPPRGEVVGEWLGPGRQDADRLALDRLARIRVAPIQPHPPELAHVAEAQLAAVGQRQHDVDVAILGSARRHDEELAGHLEVDRQDRGLRGGRCGPGPRPRRRVRTRARPGAACRAGPRLRSRVPPPPPRRPPARGSAASAASSELRTHDPRARHQAAQVAGDRLDFRQFGHA